MWEVWLWAALCSGLVLSAPHLGESTELAWLLVHESPQQSPLVLRRITPKSVFLAPTFTSCSEGYRQDSMGRCVKVVKLNQQAQWEFFLQKLNSMYAAPPEPPKKESSSNSLRFPIPIEEDPASTTTTTLEPTTSATTEMPTETQFLIVVANTTMPMETTAETSTTEGTTTTTMMQTTEETVPASTMRTTLAMESTTMPTTVESTGMDTSTMTTSMKCEDCEDAEETVVTETFTPPRSTVRFPDFPDQRKRPSSSSSYVRFPESYPASVVSPYWWPHSWDRSQGFWQPQPPSHHNRPTSYRPHWSTPF